MMANHVKKRKCRAGATLAECALYFSKMGGKKGTAYALDALGRSPIEIISLIAEGSQRE